MNPDELSALMPHPKHLALWVLAPMATAPLLGYDTVEGFVICAVDRNRARAFAADRCGDEGGAVWLDPEQSTCLALFPSRPGVILREFRAG